MNALQLFPDSFHTGVMAEALQAKIERKSTIWHQGGHFDPKFQAQGVAQRGYFDSKFQVEGVASRQSFLQV